VITRSPSGQVTIRQSGRCLQIIVYLTIACCLWVPCLIGIGVMIWLYLPAGLACMAVAVLAVAWGCSRAMRMQVRFDDGGMTIRNFWRTRRLSWDDVSQFTDGGKDWWALRVVRRSGRPIEATGTTTGAKGIVKSGVLTAIGEVAARYRVSADLSGRNLVARAAIAAAGEGPDGRSITRRDPGTVPPAGVGDSQPEPQQADEPGLDGHADRGAGQPHSKTIYALSLTCLACAIGSVGLGISDVIAYGILPGYLVVVGMAVGGAAATLASITWFGMVAPKATMGPQTEIVRRICRAGQTLGVLGLIFLVIGSGNGNSL